MNNYSLWNQAKLPPEITKKLDAIIRRVRIIQIIRGALAVLGVALAATMVVMAIDVAVPIYSDSIRFVISLAGLAITLATAYIALVRPLADKISPIRMARIIETRHPELQERISSALELILIGGDDATIGSSQLLELLVADARDDIAGLSAAREFRGASMRPVAFAAIIFFIVFIVLLSITPKNTLLLIKRAYAPYARLNNVASRLFTIQPEDITIVQGETVRFSLTAPGETGSRAELCIERKGEPLSIERMTKRFDLEGNDPVFEVEIPSITESFDYRMRIGKGLTRRYSVTAVPPPAFNEIHYKLEPPEYTAIPSTQFVESVEMPLSLPVGTRAEVRAYLNREMDSLLLFDNHRSISPNNVQPNATAEFIWTITTNKATSWAISLNDSRGFTNILSWANYEPLPDYPADVRLTYPSGNSYVLPTYGHLKTVFDMRDDYGVSRATLIMLPDNEKFPWTTDVEIEEVSKGLWRVVQDISLGEFMIGGAKKIRIWLEVADNLPVELGGPNISKSRTIAVNLDNAERRSLADQVRIPERDSITNLLETAAARLEEAAKKLASTTNNPSLKQKDFDAALENAEKAMSEVAEKTQEAEQKAEKGLFAGVAEKIDEVAKDSVEEARKAVEEVPLTEETEREEVIKEAVDKMNKAAEEARQTIPEILEKDALIKEASDLETLAKEEATLAKKAAERQLTDEELLDWQAKQKDLANKFGSLEDKIAQREDVRKSFMPEEEKAKADVPPKAAEAKAEAKAAEAKAEAKTAEAKSNEAKTEANATEAKSNENKADGKSAEAKSNEAKADGKSAEAKSNEPKADADAAEAKSNEAKAAAKSEPKSEADKTEERRASPRMAAEAAAKAAEAAKAKPKDEAMLAKAREAETAAKETKRAAGEAKRAKAALNAIEKDKEALKEIAKKADETKKEAESLADDALDVKLEKVRYEAMKVDPELARADELSKKADKLAEMVEKAALHPESISPAKLEALANEVEAKAEELAKSNDPILKRAAELAKEVAKAAKDTALENQEKASEASSAKAAQGNEGAPNREEDKGFDSDASEIAEEEEAVEATRKSQKAAEAAKAVKDELKKSATSPREQAIRAAFEAEALTTAATNLTARLDKAIKDAQAAAAPNQQNAAQAANKDKSGKDSGDKSEDFEALAKEAEELAKKAERVNQDAQDASKRASNQGARRAADVAESARKASKEVKEAAEAVKKAADAMPKPKKENAASPNGEGPAGQKDANKGTDASKAQELPKPPPRESINEAAKANQRAVSAERLVAQNKEETERLLKSPSQHAKDAAEAGEKAVELAKELSKSMQPSKKSDEVREKLGEAIKEAQEASKAAVETSRDTRENLPDVAATMVNRAMQQANEVAKSYDALKPQPNRPPADKEKMTKRADYNAKAAEENIEAGRRAAENSELTPEDHAENLEAFRKDVDKNLKGLSENIKQAAEAIKRDTPIALTNAHAKANVEGAKRALEEYLEEAEKTYERIGETLDELPQIVDNAQRLGREERSQATKQGMENIEITPSELAANEMNRLRDELRQARSKASDIKGAASLPSNPDRALNAIKNAENRLPDYQPGPLAKENRDRRENKARENLNKQKGEPQDSTQGEMQGGAQSKDSGAEQSGAQSKDGKDSSVQSKDGKDSSAQSKDGKDGGEEQGGAQSKPQVEQQEAQQGKPKGEAQSQSKNAQQSGSQSKGDEKQGESQTQGQTQSSGNSQGETQNAELEEKPWQESDLISGATGETKALANRLAEAMEQMQDGRDALELGDANQAREVANEATKLAEDVAKKAASSESQRQASANLSNANSKKYAAMASKRASNLLNNLLDEARREAERKAKEADQKQASGGGQPSEPKQQSGGGSGSRQKQESDDMPKEFTGERPPEVAVPTFDEFLGGLTDAASNIVAAAKMVDTSPQEAQRLAEEAIREALKLQAPSEEQKEAARLANLASQDLKLLAAKTAELAGLDPETMKVKKPKNYQRMDKSSKDNDDKKKKPARTFAEGGGGDNPQEEIDIEYEDGVSLEMPEWLRKLGFPLSEWLKYKGSLESGLPDSALEHVAPEYRNLVREYFKLLSKEK